jgi:hypothetical protein
MANFVKFGKRTVVNLETVSYLEWDEADTLILYYPSERVLRLRRDIDKVAFDRLLRFFY